MSVSGLIQSISNSRNAIRDKMVAAGQATQNDKLETLAANLEIGTGKLPDYEGSYEVTPAINEQILQTKNTSMVNDLTIKQIPYSSVSNISGGLTVTIG